MEVVIFNSVPKLSALSCCSSVVAGKCFIKTSPAVVQMGSLIGRVANEMPLSITILCANQRALWKSIDQALWHLSTSLGWDEMTRPGDFKHTTSKAVCRARKSP